MTTDVSKVVAFYESGTEEPRLGSGVGRLEFARTQVLLRRILPPPPARILDIGGGPGRYSEWLAREGYTVSLIDAVPLHVEQARTRSAGRFSADVGDARSLAIADESFDAVLMFGPLYHLLDRGERLMAWREALRVARPGAPVAATAVSRFAALLDGVKTGWIGDLDDVARVAGHLTAGAYPEAMGAGFLHRPEELLEEANAAGLADVRITAVEGPLWLLSDLEERADDGRWDLLLAAIAAIEAEPILLAASNHFLVTGVRT